MRLPSLTSGFAKISGRVPASFEYLNIGTRVDSINECSGEVSGDDKTTNPRIRRPKDQRSSMNLKYTMESEVGDQKIVFAS
jgi:hypothetical protein